MALRQIGMAVQDGDRGASGGLARESGLCPLVEGVQFMVEEEGVRLRGLILRDALEAFFGAGESPQSWLRAYAEHAEIIQALALALALAHHRRRPAGGLVLLRADDVAACGPLRWCSA